MITTAGLGFALLAAFLFTAFGLLARVLSVQSKSPVAFATLYGIFGTVFSLPIILIEPGNFQGITAIVLFTTFLATVFYGTQEATQFFMRKYLEASRSTIFYQLTPVVTFITSLIFLNETISTEKILGISFIVGGNMIAVYKHGGHVTRRGLFFALITVISLGFAYVADKAAFSHYPLGVYMVISYLFPAIYVIPFIGGNRLSALRGELSLARWKLPLLGLVSALGYYFLLKTFSVAEASIAVPIIFTSTIFTALGGIVLLGERSSVFQKLAGSVFVFIGIVLLR